MKKLYLLKSILLLCALVAGSVSAWAVDVTFTAGTDTSDELSLTKDGITISVATGTLSRDDNYRCYANSSMTISSTVGNITKIVFNCNASGTSKGGPGCLSTTTGYTYSNQVGTWTGDAESITFSTGQQCQINNFTVTYTASDSRTPVNISTLTFDPTSLVVGSGTATATAGHDTQGCTTATFTYESLDEDIATCTSAGVITPVAKGTARIKATMSIPNDDKTYRVGTATMTANITIANPSHKATFYSNGTKLQQENVEEGEPITFPSTNPSSIGGRIFMGWIKTEIAGTTDTAPTEYFTSGSMGTADVNYYAVFALEVPGGSAVITLDNETIKNNAQGKGSYSDTYNIDGWTGRYMVNNNSGTYSLQLGYNASTSSNARNSHLTTPECSGYIQSITIELRSGTTDRTFYLCSSNNLGTASLSDATYGSGSATNGSVTINVTGNTTQFHIYPDGTAYLKSVSLTYSSTKFEQFCTTVATSGTLTLNAACHDGNVIYGTFYTKRAYVMPATLKGSVVSVDGEGKLVVDEVYDGSKNEVVPANTALLISTNDTFEGTKDYTITYSTGGDDYSEYNMLKGTLTADETTEGSNCKFYRLTMHNGTQIGFWWGAAEGAAFNPGANKAYLAVPNAAARQGFAFGDETQGISQVENGRITTEDYVYDLQGRRVVNPNNGLYVVNGKKIFVK